ncbi:GNAT family protein [Microtetraspora sp. NBRC 16547]|uniref:GNAT family N-acetyltransferase n=1 Tax=Microtetraspora sp. NBRC 16547 TaxID=3030993 RepID=UPI0025534F42|nr:GNAT family protein [Microtetraspora sp. NBRC 16547]
MHEPLVVPELIAGSNLVLRPWTLDDVDLVREAATDELIPLITTVPSIYSDAEGIAFIERQWARATTRQGYSFAIARTVDGRAIGQVGLWPLAHGRASLGYWVAKSARGQAIAVEALRAVSFWGSSVLKIPRLELYVEPWNVASWKTAERVGFTREGLLRSWQEVGAERRDMYMYAMLLGELPA